MKKLVAIIWMIFCLLAISCPGKWDVFIAGGAIAQETVADPDETLRGAIQRAIAPIENSMIEYRKSRRCFSCHHHAHAIIGLTEMANRGLKVNRDLLQIQFAQTVGQTQSVEHRYTHGSNIGGGVDTTGHALQAMRTGGYSPDDMTRTMVQWILNRDQNRGFWTGTRNRPPTQTSDLTRTWLCLDALEHFGTSELSDQIKTRKSKSRKWLLSVDAKSTEDASSQIRALSLLGNTEPAITKLAEKLIGQQRSDGGWAQTSEMKSDAYATGSVLITLNQHAGRLPNEEFYQRGIKFLRLSQRGDGTWHVKTRATPVQKYFESGFPHGRDQYISMTATCWAATAMALTLPKQEPKIETLTSPLRELSREDQGRFLVRFKKEIWPLLSDKGESSCLHCHDQKHRSSFRMAGNAAADFSMMLRTGLFHPEDPSGVPFLVKSNDEDLMMPPSEFSRWSDGQIETVRRFARDLYRASYDSKIK